VVELRQKAGEYKVNDELLIKIVQFCHAGWFTFRNYVIWFKYLSYTYFGVSIRPSSVCLFAINILLERVTKL
jgi:hypothetical protein